MFVHRIENIGHLRKECVFDFVRGRDPVPRSNHDRRTVQLIEGKLRDLGGEGLQCAASFAGVGRKQDFAGLA